jgi:hypothetical protein
LGGHDWQAQRIVGERQTPSGLEYEVSPVKTLWLPRATFNTKLVQRYNVEQWAGDHSPHTVVVAVAKTGQPGGSQQLGGR